MRNLLQRRRLLFSDGKVPSRVFCPCEGCCMNYNRMLFPMMISGEAIRFRRIPGFSGNFSPRLRVGDSDRWGRMPLRRNPGGRRR